MKYYLFVFKSIIINGCGGTVSPEEWSIVKGFKKDKNPEECFKEIREQYNKLTSPPKDVKNVVINMRRIE